MGLYDILNDVLFDPLAKKLLDGRDRRLALAKALDLRMLADALKGAVKCGLYFFDRNDDTEFAFQPRQGFEVRLHGISLKEFGFIGESAPKGKFLTHSENRKTVPVSAAAFAAKKIVFVTGKGGVGKSLTAAAIAHQVAAQGRRVLLAEL